MRSDYATLKSKYDKIKRVNKYKFLQKEKENLAKLSRTNPKLFWQNIKRQYSKQESRADDLDISEMYGHFKNLYSAENTINDDTAFNNSDLQDEELDKDITMPGLREAVFCQKNNKSSGPDVISAEIYKCAFEDTSPFILNLFNRLISNGEYPTCFGEGIIHPIHKSGDKNNPRNYRGITLINILSNIYSQLILNRLTRWSEQHSKISQNQFCFQKKKSTINCIVLLHSIIAKTLTDGKKLYCAFLDFEKCFDEIDRNLLFAKLINETISSKLISAIKSMYSVVKSKVRYNPELSPFIEA